MVDETRSGDEAVLEKLAIELGRRGFQRRLVISAPERVARVLRGHGNGSVAGW